jgi:hypothetical protein
LAGHGLVGSGLVTEVAGNDWRLGFYGGRTLFPLSLSLVNSHSTFYSTHFKRVGNMLPWT